MIIPAGWGLWFHGTGAAFEAFDDAKLLEGQDCNSGLGHFLSASVTGAMEYAEAFEAGGLPACVLVVAADEEKAYSASTEEYWCVEEARRNDGIAYGVQVRAGLAAQGYKSLILDDLEGYGAAMAAFQARSLRVLGHLTMEEAWALDDWVAENPLPLDEASKWVVVRAFMKARLA